MPCESGREKSGDFFLVTAFPLGCHSMPASEPETRGNAGRLVPNESIRVQDPSAHYLLIRKPSQRVEQPYFDAPLTRLKIVWSSQSHLAPPCSGRDVLGRSHHRANNAFADLPKSECDVLSASEIHTHPVMPAPRQQARCPSSRSSSILLMWVERENGDQSHHA